MRNIDDILNKSKSLSDLARFFFGKENYTNRTKSKQILFEYGVNWEEWLNSKKEKRKNFCLCCGKEIIGQDRMKRKFCSRSCSATYNNGKRKVNNDNKKTTNHCLNCGKEIKGKKYCNHNCEIEYKERIFVEKWERGKINGFSKDGSISQVLKKYLLKQSDYKCQSCGFSGINEYTGNSILQIHHIDGDVFNTKKDNLQVLCPNCHAMTDNYGSRNKNATRVDRRTKHYLESLEEI